MENDTYHSRLLTVGIWFSALAAGGFMIADMTTRPTAMWLAAMPVYCLTAFALMHSITTIGKRSAIWFLAIGTIVPFVAEYLNANFGAVFGSQWFGLTRDLRITVGLELPGEVPLTAVLTWYGMLYVVFLTSVRLLRASRANATSFGTVPMVAGLLMSLWQLAAGPANMGRAIVGFDEQGIYHAMPLSSFVGWFVTTLFVVLFFQVVEPGAVNSERLTRPEQRLAPLAYGMFGASLLYSSAICMRVNATGAGWLGVVVFLVYALVMAARARILQPEPRMTEAPSGT